MSRLEREKCNIIYVHKIYSHVRESETAWQHAFNKFNINSTNIHIFFSTRQLFKLISYSFLIRHFIQYPLIRQHALKDTNINS